MPAQITIQGNYQEFARSYHLEAEADKVVVSRNEMRGMMNNEKRREIFAQLASINFCLFGDAIQISLAGHKPGLEVELNGVRIDQIPNRLLRVAINQLCLLRLGDQSFALQFKHV